MINAHSSTRMTLQFNFSNWKAIKYILLKIVYFGTVCFREGIVPGTGYVAQQCQTKNTDITQFCTPYIWRSRQCSVSLLGFWKLMLRTLPSLNNFLSEHFRKRTKYQIQESQELVMNIWKEQTCKNIWS